MFGLVGVLVDGVVRVARCSVDLIMGGIFSILVCSAWNSFSILRRQLDGLRLGFCCNGVQFFCVCFRPRNGSYVRAHFGGMCLR